MTIRPDEIAAAITVHGPVVRVVMADVKGSSPREAGTAMLVWEGGQSGTIGGGALELQAAQTAHVLLRDNAPPRLERFALGPSLGQCCGGAVTLVSEVWDKAKLDALPQQTRALNLRGGDMPLSVRRALAQARNGAAPTGTLLMDGWLIEPVAPPASPLWIYGAGHVGRALVNVLAPLPDLAITWVDTGADRYPNTIPANVTQLVATDPALVCAHAPQDAQHLILTYSHALDLDLCHQLLLRPAAGIGLIGSKSKWARFRNRLTALGHSAAQINRIQCPIGDPSLGKHPQAIAVGVASALLSSRIAHSAAKDATA
ncbi:xanthine dehydrogenase accessory factor [Actibacterium atlanticum]|uniref:Xanthine dehydrogenase accessory factor n=1 Tax=Actibacterium atlanticum TaxID=1461693 RepID=A0A058ZMT5_9RHOB|nr:xanthine dehydrogenase accessory protein XdhC [Actibacterium atlanticum]KCV82929.1 xanthine dehydrogenase accessory factor [Actibacterium atlanticum]